MKPSSANYRVNITYYYTLSKQRIPLLRKLIVIVVTKGLSFQRGGGRDGWGEAEVREGQRLGRGDLGMLL